MIKLRSILDHPPIHDESIYLVDPQPLKGGMFWDIEWKFWKFIDKDVYGTRFTHWIPASEFDEMMANNTEIPNG